MNIILCQLFSSSSTEEHRHVQQNVYSAMKFTENVLFSESRDLSTNHVILISIMLSCSGTPDYLPAR